MRLSFGCIVLGLVAGAICISASPAHAATDVGVVRWQLAPFCNVLTLNAVVEGAGAVLSGFDDNCGGAHSAAYGTVSVNPDATLNLGVTIVTGGGPGEHLDAVLNLATVSGPFHDASGHTGTLIFDPSNPTGTPRPAPTASQARVTGACAGTGAIRAVNADGSVSCTAVFGTNTNIAAAGNATCIMGQILLTASTTVTAGGVPANGQLLSIAQNQALFSLFGTTYGGNGFTTFALPDLRGLAPNNMTYSICDIGIYPGMR